MSRRFQPQMRAAILVALEAGYQRTDEISAVTGFSTKDVSTRLCYMRGLGLVNAVRAPSAHGGTACIWRLGPSDLDETYSQADERQVVISSKYPTLGLRDPLVAALFGAPAATLMVTA
ncbi:hypothetical protein DIR46_07265 [Massilia oculi]|uniref:Transcriptional regulator n=2 Tax=Massilia oculi TaxID=945844 RepID=A0A2S2DFX1_9BURK|nr:hypothetical protein DIR46_07265 [Massilia oculi]